MEFRICYALPPESRFFSFFLFIGVIQKSASLLMIKQNVIQFSLSIGRRKKNYRCLVFAFTSSQGIQQLFSITLIGKLEGFDKEPKALYKVFINTQKTDTAATCPIFFQFVSSNSNIFFFQQPFLPVTQELSTWLISK